MILRLRFYIFEKIIKKCLNGDKNAYSFLVNKYQKPIYSLIYRLVRNNEYLYKFINEGNFSAWIFRIARNHTLDYLRKKKPELIEESEYVILNKKWEVRINE